MINSLIFVDICNFSTSDNMISYTNVALLTVLTVSATCVGSWSGFRQTL